MKILDVDVFDLFGNGTLAIKTNVECEESDKLRFCWYVKSNGEMIYKGHYQKNPFMGLKVENLGVYVIKAFVKNGDEKEEFELKFNVNKNTSPELVKDEEFTITPIVKNISGSFWQFSLKEEMPADTKYAWYIFEEGSNEPVHKQMYSDSSEYVHKFTKSGKYQVKAFAVVDGNKVSNVSEWFEVK